MIHIEIELDSSKYTMVVGLLAEIQVSDRISRWNDENHGNRPTDPPFRTFGKQHEPLAQYILEWRSENERNYESHDRAIELLHDFIQNRESVHERDGRGSHG